MSIAISGDSSATDAWLRLLRACLRDGGEVNIQRVGEATRELQVPTLSIPLRRAVVAAPARKLSYRFMAAEALWVLAGQEDVASVARYAARYQEFSDDGKVLAGAYGPRFVAQLPYVAAALRRDPSTRQAVITLWQPSPPASKDVPCTLALQWLLREEALHCHVFMRSSDLWLGLPYDLFTFTCMTYRVLQEVNHAQSPADVVYPGRLTWTAGSAHLYARDQERARQLLVEHTPLEAGLLPEAWEQDQQAMLQDLARSRDQTTHAEGSWKLRPW